MRRLLTVGGAAILVAVAAGFALAELGSDDQTVVPRPEWSLGDWWEFSDASSEWRLTAIAREGDHYVLARSRRGQAVRDGAGRTTYHADLDGWITKTIARDGKVGDSGDKHEWVRFPMRIGDRWQFTIWGRLAGTTQRLTFDYDCVVDGWDTIDIGGRSVRALKITSVNRGRGIGGGGVVTGWYAPEAKRVVRLTPHYAGGPKLEVMAFSVQSSSAPIVAPAPPPPSNQSEERRLANEKRERDKAEREGEARRREQERAAEEQRKRAEEQRLAEEQRKHDEAQRLAEEARRREEQRVAEEQRKRAEEQRLAEERRKRDEARRLAEEAQRRDTQAPVITVNHPLADAKIDGDRLVLLGLVTDDTAVARIHITVNGAEIERAPEVKAGARGVPVRATLKLAPGLNVIEVTATDAAGNVAQVVRTVTRVVVTPLAVGRRRVAVVIGIGDYEHPAIPKLRYAVKDAEAVYQVLVGPAGFDKENVLLLTDRSGQRPTLRNIKSALGTFLARSARKDDTVIIFFAGHGAPEIDVRGLERDGLAKYLIPSDADPNDLYATALSMDEIHTVFGRIESERMIMFVDACYSGAAGGRTFASNRLRTRDIAVDDQFLDRLTRAKGRAIVTASRPSELSVELPEFGHGLFTYYLVEGLKGAADLNRDGVVTLQELYEYVEAQVSRKSRAVGGNQHPVMKGEFEGPFPLATVRPR